MQMTLNIKSDQYPELSDNQNMDILNHRKAATFLVKAARLHMEAAKQRMEGNSDKVTECTLVAKYLLHRVSDMG